MPLLPSEIPFFGTCPNDKQIVDSFLFEFDFNNWVAIGQSVNFTLTTEFLKSGPWELFYEQVFPIDYTVHRPSLDGSVWAGNWLIDGATGANEPMVTLTDDPNGIDVHCHSNGEISVGISNMGSFLLLPGNAGSIPTDLDGNPITDESLQCACSGDGLGLVKVTYNITNIGAFSSGTWAALGTPPITKIRLRGQRQ